jgi:hypothetical protein
LSQISAVVDHELLGFTLSQDKQQYLGALYRREHHSRDEHWFEAKLPLAQQFLANLKDHMNELEHAALRQFDASAAVSSTKPPMIIFRMFDGVVAEVYLSTVVVVKPAVTKLSPRVFKCKITITGTEYADQLKEHLREMRECVKRREYTLLAPAVVV